MKIQRLNKSLGCLILCICLLLPTCKTHKESVSALPAEKAMSFNTLSGKLNVEIITPKNTLNSDGSLRIIKDKIIQLSVQPFLGVEAFRMALSEDTVLVIDRFNQQYALEATRDVPADILSDFNFHRMQTQFINDIFHNEKTKLTLKSSSGKESHLNIAYSNIMMDNNFELNFDVPSKYKRIPLADALNLIRKL